MGPRQGRSREAQTRITRGGEQSPAPEAPTPPKTPEPARLKLVVDNNKDSTLTKGEAKVVRTPRYQHTRALGILGDNDPDKVIRGQKGILALAVENQLHVKAERRKGIKKPKARPVDMKKVAAAALALAAMPVEHPTPAAEYVAREVHHLDLSVRPEIGPIPFERAVRFARAAGDATGVNPALILAILKQESDMGAHIGQCYLSNAETGAGRRIDTGVYVKNVMNPRRDVGPFLELMRTPGIERDPFQTPVSCPLETGYGGAMGPGQVIASTQKAHQQEVGKLLGRSVVDPYDPEAAIMFIAVTLHDNGATRGGRQGQYNAARKYFAGRRWQGEGGASYADSVFRHLREIEPREAQVVIRSNWTDRPQPFDQ